MSVYLPAIGLITGRVPVGGGCGRVGRPLDEAVRVGHPGQFRGVSALLVGALAPQQILVTFRAAPTHPHSTVAARDTVELSEAAVPGDGWICGRWGPCCQMKSIYSANFKILHNVNII